MFIIFFRVKTAGLWCPSLCSPRGGRGRSGGGGCGGSSCWNSGCGRRRWSGRGTSRGGAGTTGSGRWSVQRLHRSARRRAVIGRRHLLHGHMTRIHISVAYVVSSSAYRMWTLEKYILLSKWIWSTVNKIISGLYLHTTHIKHSPILSLGWHFNVCLNHAKLSCTLKKEVKLTWKIIPSNEVSKCNASLSSYGKNVSSFQVMQIFQVNFTYCFFYSVYTKI